MSYVYCTFVEAAEAARGYVEKAESALSDAVSFVELEKIEREEKIERVKKTLDYLGEEHDLEGPSFSESALAYLDCREAVLSLLSDLES